MVVKHLRRLHYKLKGIIAERNRFEFTKEGAELRKNGNANLGAHLKHPTKQSYHTVSDTKHSSRGKHAPPIRTLESAYRELPAKSIFHSYHREGLYNKVARKLNEKGMPPLPILAMVIFIVLAAVMPLISLAILTIEPTNVDVLIAVYTSDGRILKGTIVILAAPDYSEIKFSALTGPDGLAYFKLLPVNAKFAIYAERGGERINLEERELKVPFAGGKTEIIIERRAANG
ncbi:MAG TPA: hypothetical protein VJI13_00475 [Candidatus Norongarragalinales archaeon]|nr:hypothetical protein [Candidatus Norongarragalinales archaeon]